MPEEAATSYPPHNGAEAWEPDDPDRPRTMAEIIDALHMEGATSAWEMSMSKTYVGGFPNEIYTVRAAALLPGAPTFFAICDSRHGHAVHCGLLDPVQLLCGVKARLCLCNT